MRKLRWSKGHFKERGTVGKWAAWPTALSTSPCGPVVPITFTKGKKKQNQKPRPYSGGSVPSNTSYSRVCWLQEQQSTQPGLQGAAQLLHPCPLQKIRFHWAVAESGAFPSFGSSGILLSWDRIAQGRLISIVHIPKITPLSPPWTICSNSTERNLKVPPHCCLQQKVVPPPAARFYRSAPPSASFLMATLYGFCLPEPWRGGTLGWQLSLTEVLCTVRVRQPSPAPWAAAAVTLDSRAHRIEMTPTSHTVLSERGSGWGWLLKADDEH